MSERKSLTNTMIFDIRQTNIAKGFAILLLMWHHLFFNSPKNNNAFETILIFQDIPIECYIARFCKVCVSIFLFLSGYGLYKSWQKAQNSHSSWGIKQKFLFVKKHTKGFN